MNVITKHPIDNLGYNFIDKGFLPAGEDEYYLRNKQNKNGIRYRKLKASEVEMLVRNGNNSDDWSQIHVSEAFDPVLVKNSKFYGLVRIGKLEPFYLEFHNLRMPVGIYNSTIISCDFGDNICIDNAHYLSHYIIGNEVMIANVNELAATDYAKFGNGILKDGELEKNRVWMEVRNENGGRKILPFEKMLAGDAWLWSEFRNDKVFLKKLVDLTEKEIDKKRGYYGVIGNRCVIKDCNILKDVSVGTDAYIKGANKLKNLTINSDAERTTQIGEGCEMVNGIIGYGCRIFYGVKAVRFVMASHSQLKYGARLLNSYLGNNSTISCCEVLNSLIFPGHEQHHNNSFLCASLVMGQSNIAAGVTIGSNHNSRSPDGELIAGRGFWPGLCVSLKHNSKFASYTILAKGDYPYELNIKLPFSLVSNDVKNDELIINPGYWFLYNMYALARNSWKYEDRDLRVEKIQTLEFDFLAPDTINEMFEAIALLSRVKIEKDGSGFVTGFENGRRKVRVLKIAATIDLFTEMINYYASRLLVNHIQAKNIKSLTDLTKTLRASVERSTWQSVGGQLMTSEDIDELKKNVTYGKFASWHDVHKFYVEQGKTYGIKKLNHSYDSLLEIYNITPKQLTGEVLKTVLQKAVATRKWFAENVYESRAKDYTNPFRQMVYRNKKEMNEVVGKIEDNQFIQVQLKESDDFQKAVTELIKRWEL